MRILTLGGTGMLGHRLWASFTGMGHDSFGLVRSDFDHLYSIPGIEKENSIKLDNFFNLSEMKRIIQDYKIDLVINAMGNINQKEEADNYEPSIQSNSLFPHQMSRICREQGIRLITFSTDCIFSGKRGDYTEEDTADCTKLYGRSKLLGEVALQENSMTIRTSLIGRELRVGSNLVEWFLSQEGKSVGGFTKAIFSGFPTHSVAKIIDRVIRGEKFPHGLYHISANPISKFDLIDLIAGKRNLNIEIEPNEALSIDRSLNSNKFRSEFSYSPEDWSVLIEDLFIDWDIYSSFKL
ncbi:MAG: SDR family oxidoreductase [Bacteriovoracaceae bacterium]|nr:SDR family oxidoreductase [Bacteriovoracaceae bacterium]